MQILKMAWRNIWRNSRRTGITIAAMALALFLLVLWTSLFEGFLIRMERSLVEIELGDAQIFAPDYRDRPSLFETIEAPDELLAELDSRGFRASSRLLAGALVASGESAAGASLIGIDPERDKSVSEIYAEVQHGAWLEESDFDGVVIGARLARTLGVGPGDELVVLSQAADGSMANALYEVRGVLKLISEATDRAGIFMTHQAFRELLVMPDGAHKVTVRRPADGEFDAAVAEIRNVAATLDVVSWRELNPTLASYTDMTRGIFFVFYIVFYFAVAILLLNSMLMAVFERIREFGVLKAIGLPPERLFVLILLESGLQTLIAIVIAGVLLVPSLWYLREVGLNIAVMAGGVTFAGIVFDPIWKAHLTSYVFVSPVATLVVIVFGGTLYPALKAARLTPVEAIRHQ
jgi:ABC-type lipoprotein release transport system permease subunit